MNWVARRVTWHIIYLLMKSLSKRLKNSNGRSLAYKIHFSNIDLNYYFMINDWRCTVSAYYYELLLVNMVEHTIVVSIVYNTNAILYSLSTINNQINLTHTHFFFTLHHIHCSLASYAERSTCHEYTNGYRSEQMSLTLCLVFTSFILNSIERWALSNCEHILKYFFLFCMPICPFYNIFEI